MTEKPNLAACLEPWEAQQLITPELKWRLLEKPSIWEASLVLSVARSEPLPAVYCMAKVIDKHVLSWCFPRLVCL